MNKEKRHEAYTKRRPEAIRKAREWQIDNPGKVRQYKWQFRQDKPMVHRYYNLKSKNKGKIKMTANEFNSWYESEPKQCFYCDIPLDLLSLNNHYTNHRDSHNLFTIDRKECGGDYSLENIVLACPLCNLVKSNFFSADTMRELAQRYVKPRWQQQAGIEPEALFPDIDKDELIVEMRREYEQKLTLKEKGVTERVEKQERESMSGVFGYIEDMFPELRDGYWNTKGWIEFKNEQLGQVLKGG